MEELLAMSNVEDILYQAYDEGIYDEVMRVSKSLSTQDKYKYMEVSDRMDAAYQIVKDNKGKKSGTHRKGSK